MDEKRYRIAAASTDNICVNTHFGRAVNFYIADVDVDGKIYPIEERKVSPICDRGQHDDNELKTAVEALSDCDVVLAARIGYGASEELKAHGILALEVQDFISEAIEKVIIYLNRRTGLPL